MPQPKHKYDIFEVLSKISTRDREYFNNLTIEEWKPIQPLVLLKWFYGTTDPSQLYLLNTFVNPYVFDLHKDKKLIINLMMASASGSNKRYKWHKTGGKSSTAAPESIKVIQEYYKYNKSKAVDALRLLSNDEIVSHAELLGRQPTELTKIKKELRTR